MRVLKSGDGGYPLEYLLTRIRVRGAPVITDWRPFLADTDPLAALSRVRPGRAPVDGSPEGIWKSLLREYQWVYGQMDYPTKKIFFSFFLYFEIRTLVLCLRNRAANKGPRIRDLLASSLLAESLKSTLAEAGDVASSVMALQTAFVSLSPAFRRLKEIHDRRGLQGVEQAMRDLFLEYAVGGEHNPVLKGFIRHLIDLRNLMILHKHSRWELPGTPAFLAGGALNRTRLREALSARQPADMESLPGGSPGMKGRERDVETGRSGDPERPLLLRITRFLRLGGREPSGVGTILDYLWRLYVETVNMGILYHCGKIGRQAAVTELIT